MPRRSRRPRTTLLLLVLVAVTIITLDARGSFHVITSGLKSVAADAFAPVRSGVDDIVEPIGSFLAGSVHYGAVRQQNQKLQAEIGQLKQQIASQADADQAMQQLTALLNLPFLANLQTVPAEVTDYDISDFAATVDISVGRADGVQLNMPVVGAGGLVGLVVHGPAPGSLAVLTGEGSGKPLSADLVPNNTPLTKGEQFATSGLQGALFPPGIPVASVVTARTGATATQESVVLQPLADLAHLRYVSVVLWGPAA